MQVKLTLEKIKPFEQTLVDRQFCKFFVPFHQQCHLAYYMMLSDLVVVVLEPSTSSS